MSRKSIRVVLIVLTFAVPLFPIGLGLLRDETKVEHQTVQWISQDTTAETIQDHH